MPPMQPGHHPRYLDHIVLQTAVEQPGKCQTQVQLRRIVDEINKFFDWRAENGMEVTVEARFGSDVAEVAVAVNDKQ